jgi:hypothetical protein
LRQLGDQHEESKASLASRLDQLERDLRAAVEHSENSLAASIGELEDRVERSSAPTSSQRLT